MPDRRVNVSSESVYEPEVGFSRAVRIGPHVVVAGTVGEGGDIAAQARDVLRRIEIALHEVGANMTDVVRTRIYVTDIGKWREVGAVHAEVFGNVRPVTSMLQVSALIAPRFLVEIEADAYVAD
jgi:enamine deaminase RidA (YjgF/YER057c/UK114 family)